MAYILIVVILVSSCKTENLSESDWVMTPFVKMDIFWPHYTAAKSRYSRTIFRLIWVHGQRNRPRKTVTILADAFCRFLCAMGMAI